jgi:hypothetical protein
MLLPGQQNIQDYPRYLTNIELSRAAPKKKGSKKPKMFLFLVKTMSSVLSGLTD